MSHIKEPKGIDFITESEPLTDKDRQEISKFIADYKANYAARKLLKRKYKPQKTA